MNPWEAFLVAMGSALGAILRQATADGYAAIGMLAFPWDTLTVNALGSLLVGYLAALTAGDGRLPLSPQQRLFVMGGFCGGFTTFSVFSLESLELIQDGAWGLALANMGGTAALCLAMVWIGHGLATHCGNRGSSG